MANPLKCTYKAQKPGDLKMISGEENLLTELANASCAHVVYDFNRHPDWLSAITANQVAYMPYMGSDSEPEELARCLKAINDSKLLGDVNLKLTSISVTNHD